VTGKGSLTGHCPGCAKSFGLRRHYSVLKLSVSVPLFQVRVPLLKVCSMGRCMKFNTHCCCSPISLSMHPLAPITMSLTVSVVPVIVAGPLIGAQLGTTASQSCPCTTASCALMPPDVAQGRSSPFAVPEMLRYFVHGADGRNTAQDDWGGEVVVEPGTALVDVGDSTETGTAVSGTAVLTSPQDVSSTPTNKRGTMYCHNPGWLRLILVPPMSATA
jgi:hypothetical protein